MSATSIHDLHDLVGKARRDLECLTDDIEQLESIDPTYASVEWEDIRARTDELRSLVIRLERRERAIAIARDHAGEDGGGRDA